MIALKSAKMLALCCWLLLSLPLQAQSYLGIYAGINSGSFSGDAPSRSKYAPKINLTAGFSFDLKVKEDVFITLAPGYTRTGSSIKFPYINEEEETKYRDSIDLSFQLIHLPLMMKIISNNQKFQFTSGFELGIPLKLTADNGQTDKDITDQINNMSFNMLFGIGYRIPIDRSLLVLGVTYSQGLTNLSNNLDAPQSELPRVRFSTFRFTASYNLPLGKHSKE